MKKTKKLHGGWIINVYYYKSFKICRPEIKLLWFRDLFLCSLLNSSETLQHTAKAYEDDWYVRQ